MAKEYVPIFLDWATVTRELNAQEKGRLIDAIVAYATSGDWQEQIKGNERYVFPGYQVRIDRWYEVSESRSQASKVKQNGTNANKPQQTATNRNKTPKDKVEVKVEVEGKVKDLDLDLTRAREEGPFGLTGEEIHESLQRDQQIEDAAINAGLNTSIAALVEARNLADKHGLEALLEAIKTTPLSAQKPSWAYVKGVLENGKAEHRGNRGAVEEPRTSGKFSHLFSNDKVF